MLSSAPYSLRYLGGENSENRYPKFGFQMTITEILKLGLQLAANMVFVAVGSHTCQIHSYLQWNRWHVSTKYSPTSACNAIHTNHLSHTKHIDIAQQWLMPLLTVHKMHHLCTSAAVVENGHYFVYKLMHYRVRMVWCTHMVWCTIVTHAVPWWLSPLAVLSHLVCFGSTVHYGRQHAHNSGLDTVCTACLALRRVWPLCNLYLYFNCCLYSYLYLYLLLLSAHTSGLNCMFGPKKGVAPLLCIRQPPTPSLLHMG